jgi:hypothetical protein
MPAAQICSIIAGLLYCDAMRGSIGSCRRHGDVLGVTLLQRDAAAGRERAVGDDPGEGERLHLFRWLGVPAEGLLQRPRVRHAAGGPVPRTAQRSLGFAGAFLLPAATLLRCGVDSFASETC